MPLLFWFPKRFLNKGDSMTKWFRIIGRLEGVSFLMLLFLAMPMKYYAANPVGVRVLGPLHGGLFVLYWALVFLLAANEQWPWRKQLLAYVAAIVPFGTFLFERRYLGRNSSNSLQPD